MFLQARMQKVPKIFNVFSGTFSQQVQMCVIHGCYPDSDIGRDSAYCYAVPRKYFVFIRVEWDIGPCAVGENVPDCHNFF